jgi:hypothetical protein
MDKFYKHYSTFYKNEALDLLQYKPMIKTIETKFKELDLSQKKAIDFLK